MSFLFGKKKQFSNSPNSGGRDAHPSSASPPSANGLKEREKQSGGAQSITPDSSVNNSLNSLGGAATPSPEQGLASRTSHEQDNQVRLFYSSAFLHSPDSLAGFPEGS